MAPAIRPDPDGLLAAFARTVREKIAQDVERERVAAEKARAGVARAAREAIGEARRRGLCGRAWLFGSFAWGQPGERSDVDVLVEAARDPDAVAALLGEACGRDVHVLRRETAPEALVARALSEGEAL